ncbi:hypothetical protein [Kitasatospora sp. NPDC101183]|uniref:hypothetical protein n=1 Tax=Kitasatospora sp. NPDC101183 TaxID=3364100 RepID=UPI00381478B7
MKHPRTVVAGVTALALGGGLLGWHVYLDRTSYRPAAVQLGHGECLGLLDDPSLPDLLGGQPRVRVRTDHRDTGSPTVTCSVTGAGGRRLTAEASPGPARRGGDGVGSASFVCGDARYHALVRLTGPDDRLLPDGPDSSRMAELARDFARRAAERPLHCPGGPEGLAVV